MDSSAGAEGISFPAFCGILGRFSGFDGLFAAFNFFPAVYFHFFEKVLTGGIPGSMKKKGVPSGKIV
jgi:hypothetical protein